MITETFLKKLGFENISISKPESSSSEENIIEPANKFWTINKDVHNGIFIHKNNKLLVTFNKANSTIIFGTCDDWTKYFENPQKALWLMSLHRDKSDEKYIKKVFTMVVIDHEE